MDDHHSRQQIDELAELYLTSFVDNAPAEEQDAVEEAAQKEAESPLEGPEPIRLSPKLSAEGPTSPLTVESDDSHPMLRLTEEQAADDNLELTGFDTAAATAMAKPSTEKQTHNQTARENDEDTSEQVRQTPQAMIEAVILGNLPGMSGPWLTQYAQLLAQTKGPVALVHLGEDSIDLELIEPRAEAEPAPSASLSAVRIPPMRAGMSGLVGLLDALVTNDKAGVRSILVRMDAPGDAQTLSQLAALNDWTVLCGSDDASVAGVVHQLRTMVRSDPRLADRNVGLMVMGSEESAAHQTAQRIADDLRDDLVEPVELIGHLKRMQPVQVRDIGSFADPVSVWPQLVSWFDTVESPEEVNAPKTIPAAEPLLTAETEALTAPVSSPKPRPQFRQTAPPPADDARPTHPRVAQAQEPTRPAPQPRVLDPQPELDLVALLGQGSAKLDNPTVLEARIPDQPKTQLAVDAEGVVHILAQQQEGIETKAALMGLIEAGRWVNEHLELIALTQRDRAFINRDPVLHLMTDRPDQTTRLVGKLGGQVSLHLLQQVQVGSATGWFCAPLG